MDLHAVDIIRDKRDGRELSGEQIRFMAQGAADATVPDEQLAAWLMACWLRGLSLRELNDLTEAMRCSGETLDPSPLGGKAVDKHSTGGVGDKTSFLVAPLAAAAGVYVPMISGRALGHTGGTLDKLESIPGYRTQLQLSEMMEVLRRTHASIVGQTKNLVPADRVLYALRDRTATVESPYLICASIMSKKLAAGLNGLVLDVKTGSGAFLTNREEARLLAALMVETGERSGTQTVALMTNMDAPLGRMAGNWLEIMECVELLQDRATPGSEDVKELSLQLAGWMIYLGGRATTPQQGYAAAAARLEDGSAYEAFLNMIKAQGGDTTIFADAAAFHRPAATTQFKAQRSGVVATMDTYQIGLAVQRLGAGRETAGEPMNAHAGIEFLKKTGDRVKEGETICTLFAASQSQLAEPTQLLERAIKITESCGSLPPLVSEVIQAKEAKTILKERESLGSAGRL